MMSAHPRSRAGRIITGPARNTTRQLVPGAEIIRPPAHAGTGGLRRVPTGPRFPSDRVPEGTLDRAADRAENRADLVAQEDQGDDRNDRDEGEDQRVLRETLAFLVAAEGCDESMKKRHAVGYLLSRDLPKIPPGGAQPYEGRSGASIRPDRK